MFVCLFCLSVLLCWRIYIERGFGSIVPDMSPDIEDIVSNQIVHSIQIFPTYSSFGHGGDGAMSAAPSLLW